MDSLYGSICLSDIPREVMKKVVCKDGKTRVFVNLSAWPYREPKTFDGRVYTHYVSCAPKKEERKEGVNYLIGNFQTYAPQAHAPSAEDIAAAPSVGDNDDLPF